MTLHRQGGKSIGNDDRQVVAFGMLGGVVSQLLGRGLVQPSPQVGALEVNVAVGCWEGYNLVIHELAHKLDMLNGDANGLPPLHSSMRLEAWATAMQSAYDALNVTLDADPEVHTEIDPYAAENPAEFFAVTSEYFFSAPDLLQASYPEVYAQLQAFYRQDPLARLQGLQKSHPDYAEPH